MFTIWCCLLLSWVRRKSNFAFTGSGHSHTGSQAAASGHASHQGGRGERNGVVHRGSTRRRRGKEPPPATSAPAAYSHLHPGLILSPSSSVSPSVLISWDNSAPVWMRRVSAPLPENDVNTFRIDNTAAPTLPSPLPPTHKQDSCRFHTFCFNKSSESRIRACSIE